MLPYCNENDHPTSGLTKYWTCIRLRLEEEVRGKYGHNGGEVYVYGWGVGCV